MAYTTIDDPSEYFTITLYAGNGSDDRSITNSANAGNFKPDWVWGKNRSQAGRHTWSDSSRGPTKNLFSERTDAESTEADVLQAFETNGFQVGTDTRLNSNGDNFVAWQWKANGGSTTSFSASSAQLAGTRQSNTTAGFSIITYTGDGNNNATIPHGLNSAPKFVIIKERGNATNWYVGHNSTFTTGEIFLNLTSAVAAAFGPFNKTAPGSSNITLGTDGSVNGSSDTYVCYAFAEIQGYSKFGSYTGNGNADGAFVYTGFKPAWIMGKRSSGAHGWFLFDDVRDTFNPTNQLLEPNLSNAETNDSFDIDILSNGFKLRGSENTINGNGETYIYMAFARHPFVSSEGVPTTAR